MLFGGMHIAALGTARPAWDWYVDPINGSNSNSGKSLGAAFATIGHAAFMAQSGQRIGIVPGAVVRESFTPAADNITVGCAGRGTKPRITGLDLLGTSWTQTAINSIVAQFTDTSFSNLNLGNVASQAIQGTEYTAGSSGASITSVSFMVYRVGTIASGNILATIYDNSGGTPTTKLATSSNTVDATTITTSASGQTVTFTFSTPVALAAGAKVVICAEKTFTTSSSNFIKMIGGAATASWPGRWIFTPWTRKTDFVMWIQIQASVNNGWQQNLAVHPRVVMFNDTYGNQQASTSGLSKSLDWTWSGGVITVYATAAPNTIWASIEVKTRSKVITTNGRQNLTLSDLRIDGGDYGIDFSGALSGGHTISRCDVWNNVDLGIFCEPGSNLYPGISIIDCTTQRNGGWGIVVGQGAVGWIIKGHTSYRDAYVLPAFDDGTGANLFGGGISLSQFGASFHGNNLVTQCEVSYAGIRDDGSASDPNNKGYGIWSDTARNTSPATCDVVERCTTHHNNRSGLFCEKSSYLVWRSCISYANGQYGLRVDADADADAGAHPNQNNSFLNITCYGNTGGGVYSAGGYNQTNLSIHDDTFANILSTANVGPDLTAKWGGDNLANNGSNNTYTSFYIGPARTGFVNWGGGTTYNDYASLSAAGITALTGVLTSDPLLTNPAGANFALQAGSPARGAGVAQSLSPTDLLGNPFTTPTIGAFA